MDTTIILQSIITCPVCGNKQEEIMPIDACQFYHRRRNEAQAKSDGFLCPAVTIVVL